MDKKTQSLKEINNGETSSMNGNQIVPLKHIEWSPENEMIMVEWCDIAQCYKWLNSRAYNSYSCMHAWFTIPTITLSTITGTASFAQTNLPVAMQPYAPMVIGTINILIGVLTTIQQYLKISELKESYRVSAISWDKFSRNIRIELSKAPNERTSAAHFIKSCRQEFDRLIETSPLINERIIREFISIFQGKEGTIERQRFEELRKPDLCNAIVSANKYRHHWYLEEPSNIQEINDIFDKDNNKNIGNNNDLMNSNKENIKEETKISNELEINLLDEFVNVFTHIHGRIPNRTEIENYTNELIDNGRITFETLVQFLDKMTKKNEMTTIKIQS